MRQMKLDGPLTDIEKPRYLKIVETSFKQHQNLILTLCETINAHALPIPA
jgi:hypothetical protein